MGTMTGVMRVASGIELVVVVMNGITVRVVVEESLLALSASTETRLLPAGRVLVPPERTLVPVSLLKMVVVIMVCTVVRVVSLRYAMLVLDEVHSSGKPDLRRSGGVVSGRCAIVDGEEGCRGCRSLSLGVAGLSGRRIIGAGRDNGRES